MPLPIAALPPEAAALVLLLVGLLTAEPRGADAAAEAMLAVLPGI